MKRMYRTLGVSTSGYYAWSQREPSARSCMDEVLQNRIVEIHAASRGTYGVPRIHAELAVDGVAVGRKRISRLMRRAGIQGISRRHRPDPRAHTRCSSSCIRQTGRTSWRSGSRSRINGKARKAKRLWRSD